MKAIELSEMRTPTSPYIGIGRVIGTTIRAVQAMSEFGMHKVKDVGNRFGQVLFERGLTPFSTNTLNNRSTDTKNPAEQAFQDIQTKARSKVIRRIIKKDPDLAKRIGDGTESVTDYNHIELLTWLETRRDNIRVAQRLFKAIEGRNPDEAAKWMELKVLLSQGPVKIEITDGPVK